MKLKKSYRIIAVYVALVALATVVMFGLNKYHQENAISIENDSQSIAAPIDSISPSAFEGD